MRIRLPWTLRRSHAAPAAAAGALTPAAGASTVGVPEIPLDPEFASEFRARAQARDATPVLGPWGGLGDTARFAVSATRFHDSLVTQRWSDQVASSSAAPLARGTQDFLARLASLASYADPTGALDESGSPFADSLPIAGGTGTFVAQPSAPSVPAFRAPAGQRPGFPPLPAPAAARAAGRAAVSRAARDAVSPTAQPPSPALQRRAEGAARVRGVVSEPAPVRRAGAAASEGAAVAQNSQAPVSPQETPVGSPGPLPVDPGPAGFVTADEPLLTLARTPASPPPSPAVDPGGPASSLRDVGRPPTASLAAGATSQADVTRHAESAATPRPGPSAENDDARVAAPFRVGGEEAGAPLGALAQDAAPASPSPSRPDELPLAGAGVPPELAPAQRATPATGGLQPVGTAEDASRPEVATRLVAEEAPPPLGGSAGSAGATATAAAPGSPPLRRFAVGEPLAPGTTTVPAVARLVARGESPASPPGRPARPPAGDLPVSRGTGPLGPAEAATRAVIEATSGGLAAERIARAEAARRAPLELAAPVARTVDATTPVTTTARGAVSQQGASARPELNAEQLLVPLPASPPLPVEQPAAGTTVRRTASASAVESLPGVLPAMPPGAPPAAASLPLARPDRWPAAGEAPPAAGGAASSGPIPSTVAIPSVARSLVPAAGAPAAAVHRASGGAEGAGDGSSTAVGEIRAAGDPAKADEDLDRLTEKVWQRIRRTLQLERERRRGLP